MSAVNIAQARRADRIRTINRSISNLDRQIARGDLGADGMKNSYLTQHAEWCKGEKVRLLDEVHRLSELSDEELVAELVPEVEREKAIAKDLEENGPVGFEDTLPARNAAPRVDIVTNERTFSARRIGDPAAEHRTLIGANGAPLPPNVVYGYDADFNLVPLA
jgi:hypothetical protein